MARIKATEIASRSYTPQRFSTPIVGAVQHAAMDAADTRRAIAVPGQLDEARTLRRRNRYGYVIVTRHYSEWSAAYEMGQPL